MTKERPIIFSAPMVRAILDGKKTQARRVVKISNEDQVVTRGKIVWMGPEGLEWKPAGATRVAASQECINLMCPYGVPGDRLWVREELLEQQGIWVYKEDRQPVLLDKTYEAQMLVWAHRKETDYCASIHMPRWASRLTLEVVNVQVERVQDISEAEARAEGMGGIGVREHFKAAWDYLNGKGSWDTNPWVWVIEFKRVGGLNG